MPIKIMPDKMTVKSICSECKHYDRKRGECGATSPFAKKGDAHYLLLSVYASCYGFDKA